MRITHLTWDLQTGGAEHFIVDLANAQSTQQPGGHTSVCPPHQITHTSVCPPHQVSIVIVNDDVEPTLIETISPAVQVIRINRPRNSRNPYWFLKAARAIRETRPDVVHTHRPNLIRFLQSPISYLLPPTSCLFRRLFSALSSASSTRSKPADHPASAGSRLSASKSFSLRPLRLCGESLLVTTVHTTGVPTNHLPLYDKVIAVSTHVAQDLKSRAPQITPIVIPNGIDFSLIPATPPHAAPPHDAPPPKPAAPFRIVQIARLDHTIKGQDILLRALALLNDPSFVRRFSPVSCLLTPVSCLSPTSYLLPPNSCLPPISVDLIGDGPSASYLRQLALDLGVSDQVVFRGRLPRKTVYSLLPTYNLLACPSRREGFGLTVIEAMAAGLPVLVPNEGAPYEIVRSVFSDLRSPTSDLPAFAFSPDNPESCAEAILRAVDTSGLFPKSDLRPPISEAFSIQSPASRYTAEYGFPWLSEPEFSPAGCRSITNGLSAPVRRFRSSRVPRSAKSPRLAE